MEVQLNSDHSIIVSEHRVAAVHRRLYDHISRWAPVAADIKHTLARYMRHMYKRLTSDQLKPDVTLNAWQIEALLLLHENGVTVLPQVMLAVRHRHQKDLQKKTQVAGTFAVVGAFLDASLNVQTNRQIAELVFAHLLETRTPEEHNQYASMISLCTTSLETGVHTASADPLEQWIKRMVWSIVISQDKETDVDTGTTYNDNPRRARLQKRCKLASQMIVNHTLRRTGETKPSPTESG